jgi:arginase
MVNIMNTIAFIGVASSWGAQIRGTEKGPDTFRSSGVLSSLQSPWIWKKTLLPSESALASHFPPGPLTLPYIEELCQRVSLSVEQVLEDHQFPVIIGGDHVVAVGTWAGVVHHLRAKQEFGLIWIDAHMDAHTMKTTPSEAYHGMPVAALLGFGEPSIVNILEEGPLLNPHHVCLIGVRSYEEGEEALLKHLGVRVYFMKEVEERGFKTVFQEAIRHVKKGTKGFGLSIDLDAFDPQDAPAVGTPAPSGLKAKEILPVLSTIQDDLSFKALEIVEYNPDRDKDSKTLLLMRDLLLNLLLKKGRTI